MSIRSKVDARRFDQRIIIQRNMNSPDEQDSAGQPIENWQPLIECWAAVDAAQVARRSLIEPYIAEEIQSVLSFTIWIRADIMSRLNITLKDRVVWRGELCNIKDVIDQQLRGRLTALIVNIGLTAE